jgi:GT2 family glycosyltransferase
LRSARKMRIASSIRYYDRPGEHNIELHGVDLLKGFQLVTNCDPSETIIPCIWAPFCSVLLSTKMIRYIGLLDERMVNHSSDSELCCRAITKGYKVVVVTASRVFHYHEVTTSKIADINEKMANDVAQLLTNISGLPYKEILAKLPLDYDAGLWGDIEFKILKRSA